MLTNLSLSILLALACMTGAAGWAQAPAAAAAAAAWLLPGVGVLSGHEFTRSMLAARAECRLPLGTAPALLAE
jgi:hypothetical protein